VLEPTEVSQFPTLSNIHRDLLGVAKFERATMELLQPPQQAVVLTDQKPSQHSILVEEPMTIGVIPAQLPQRIVTIRDLPPVQRAESVEVTRLERAELGRARLVARQVSLEDELQSAPLPHIKPEHLDFDTISDAENLAAEAVRDAKWAAETLLDAIEQEDDDGYGLALNMLAGFSSEFAVAALDRAVADRPTGDAFTGMIDKIHGEIDRLKNGDRIEGPVRMRLAGEPVISVERYRADVIVHIFDSIKQNDTERYLEALASLIEMDAVTTLLAIQGAFLDRKRIDQQVIASAAQVMHQRLLDSGADAALLQLSQQIGEIVKEVATRDLTAKIDAALEKLVETTVPSSAPASPQRNARPKPALVRTGKGELPRTVPPDGLGNRGIVERMNDIVDRPVRLRPRPAEVSPATAMRDAIDQGDVAEFLKALHALAQSKPRARAAHYRAFREAIESQPPQRSSVERLGALMETIQRDLKKKKRSDGDGQRQFSSIYVTWRTLQGMNPERLKVSARASAPKDDREKARTTLANLPMPAEPKVTFNI
jgi:hypothetical protein